MYQIRARNVNDAFWQGLSLLSRLGEPQGSRAGETLTAPAPVVTTYERPLERVLFHTKRDANPVFHLMEALWMLAGRNDATWLDQFVGDFSKRFGEYGGVMHGAYGHRWRHHFLFDQLKTIIELLRNNPEDRRIVLTMWDPTTDLGVERNDVPCNTQVYFRIRKQFRVGVLLSDGRGGVLDSSHSESVLDMTVCCRSNDAVWGAYGSNLVHFSVLQEYVAACVGVGVGLYYQLSNNFHIYKNVHNKLSPLERETDPYELRLVQSTPLVLDPQSFIPDLNTFFDRGWQGATYNNRFFNEIAVPMRRFYKAFRDGLKEEATSALETMPNGQDWTEATYSWARRRRMFQMEFER